MKLVKRVALPLAVLTLPLFMSALDAALIRCTGGSGGSGCQVRLWDPSSQSWGEPEDVPKGTIVDSAWAMGWGPGWAAV